MPGAVGRPCYLLWGTLIGGAFFFGVEPLAPASVCVSKAFVGIELGDLTRADTRPTIAAKGRTSPESGRLIGRFDENRGLHAASASGGPHSSCPTFPTRMARVLIVDDRPANRLYLRQVLVSAGHEVVEAGDGEQALARVRQAMPQLLITDLLMPVMDGYTLVRHLRADPATAAMPVMFYTATYRGTDAHRLAQACGVAIVLPKPTDPPTLLAAVNRLLGTAPLAAPEPAPDGHGHDDRNGGEGDHGGSTALAALGDQIAGHIGDVHSDHALLHKLLRAYAAAGPERERLDAMLQRFETHLGRLQHSASRLFALNELALDLSLERDLGAFLRMFCDAGRRIVDARASAVVLLDAQEQQVRRAEASGLPEAALQALQGAPLREGLVGRAWSAGAALRVGDGELPLDALPPGVSLDGAAARAWLSVPIQSSSARLGLLLFLDDRPGRAFDDEAEMLALALAGEFSVLFELFDANEALQHRAVELQLEVTQRQQAEREQAETLARLNGMVQAAMDAIVTVDEAQRIVLFNPAAERLFGHPADAMVGRLLADLLPPPARRAHEGHVAAFAAAGLTPRAMSAQRVVQGLRADGSCFPVEASISKVVLGGRVFCTAILRDITERVRAEQALELHRQDLAGFSQRLLEQEKATTRRLAQALHDELGQTLAAMRLIYDACKTPPGGNPAPDGLMRQLDQLITDANRQVREVLTELRPPLLDEDGLAAALDNELRQRRRLPHGVVLTLRAASADRRWPREVEYAAFMIAREALNNALRHARAGRVRVSLAAEDRGFVLKVGDDGRGMPHGAMPASAPGHLGLVGMRERAMAIDATLALRSLPGRGTVVQLRWKGPSQANVALPLCLNPAAGGLGAARPWGRS
jgi:PAS domain S-box-containing protein